jgi:hypothetical protein
VGEWRKSVACKCAARTALPGKNPALNYVLHELCDVFAEEGEGRVGDYNVRLLEQLDALGAAEVAASRKACAGVGVLLEEKLYVFDACRAVSVDILHFLDCDGDGLRLLALAIALVVLTERELCANGVKLINMVSKTIISIYHKVL